MLPVLNHHVHTGQVPVEEQDDDKEEAADPDLVVRVPHDHDDCRCCEPPLQMWVELVSIMTRPSRLLGMDGRVVCNCYSNARQDNINEGLSVIEQGRRECVGMVSRSRALDYLI